MARTTTIGIAWLALLVVVPSARAQTCAEGRVASEATAGRCCWPGQGFQESDGHCVGAPACPAPLVRDGDRCGPPVVVQSPAASMPASYARPEGAPPAAEPTEPSGPVAATAWPDSPPGLDHAIRNPIFVRGTDETLLLGGLMTFFGGYLAGFALGALDELARNCSDATRFPFGGGPPIGCDAWAYGLIPVVGGVLSGTVVEADRARRENVAIGLAAGLPAAAVQIFGLVITAIALFGHTDEPMSGPLPEPRPTRVSLTVTPYGGEREVGLWLDARF